jgi:hypothetical protein
MLITPCSPLANVRVSWFKLCVYLQRDSSDFFFILGARRDSMFSTIIKVELSEPNKILE